MKLTATLQARPANFSNAQTNVQKTEEAAQSSGDQVSIGETLKNGALKVAKAGAGVIGAGVGGALGVLPGIAYGIERHFDDDKLMYNLDTHQYSVEKNYHTDASREAELVEASWGISYAAAGATVAGAAAYIGFGPGPAALITSIAGGALGIGVQAAFRSLGKHSYRQPAHESYGAYSLTNCADRTLGSRPVTGPISGAKYGMLEGAHLGKLAFQDVLVPALRPDNSSKYSKY